MKKYKFKAKDWNGKTVNGTLEAMDINEVVSSIKGNGLVPIKVNEDKDNIFKELHSRMFNRVTGKQISNLTRQLSTMMTAGLALTDALSLLRNQSPSGSVMYQIIDDCLTIVRSGQPLGKALEKYKNYFGEAYVASVKAGEEGGVLEDVLSKLADSLEADTEFRGKVKGAMIYPIIVVIGMLIVAFIMMVFVIPKLLSLYGDFGSKMPAITVALMAISTWTVKLWFLFPMVPLGIYSVMKAGDKNENFRYKRDEIFMKLPIIGDLTKKTVVANTNRTLSMLLTAGISLVEALRIVSNVADNEVYRRAYLKIAERVEKGFNVSESFEEAGVFQPIVTQMVATGEATGKLDEVLLKVAKYFSTEAEQSVKGLTAAIEPLIMIVLGIGVGFLVVAVIVPIYNLTSQF